MIFYILTKIYNLYYIKLFYMANIVPIMQEINTYGYMQKNIFKEQNMIKNTVSQTVKNHINYTTGINKKESISKDEAELSLKVAGSIAGEELSEEMVKEDVNIKLSEEDKQKIDQEQAENEAELSDEIKENKIRDLIKEVSDVEIGKRDLEKEKQREKVEEIVYSSDEEEDDLSQDDYRNLIYTQRYLIKLLNPVYEAKRNDTNEHSLYETAALSSAIVEALGDDLEKESLVTKIFFKLQKNINKKLINKMIDDKHQQMFEIISKKNNNHTSMTKEQCIQAWELMDQGRFKKILQERVNRGVKLAKSFAYVWKKFNFSDKNIMKGYEKWKLLEKVKRNELDQRLNVVYNWFLDDELLYPLYNQHDRIDYIFKINTGWIPSTLGEEKRYELFIQHEEIKL